LVLGAVVVGEHVFVVVESVIQKIRDSNFMVSEEPNFLIYQYTNFLKNKERTVRSFVAKFGPAIRYYG